MEHLKDKDYAVFSQLLGKVAPISCFWESDTSCVTPSSAYVMVNGGDTTELRLFTRDSVESRSIVDPSTGLPLPPRSGVKKTASLVSNDLMLQSTPPKPPNSVALYSSDYYARARSIGATKPPAAGWVWTSSPASVHAYYTEIAKKVFQIHLTRYPGYSYASKAGSRRPATDRDASRDAVAIQSFGKNAVAASSRATVRKPPLRRLLPKPTDFPPQSATLARLPPSDAVDRHRHVPASGDNAWYRYCHRRSADRDFDIETRSFKGTPVTLTFYYTLIHSPFDVQPEASIDMGIVGSGLILHPYTRLPLPPQPSASSSIHVDDPVFVRSSNAAASASELDVGMRTWEDYFLFEADVYARVRSLIPSSGDWNAVEWWDRPCFKVWCRMPDHVRDHYKRVGICITRAMDSRCSMLARTGTHTAEVPFVSATDRTHEHGRRISDSNLPEAHAGTSERNDWCTSAGGGLDRERALAAHDVEEDRDVTPDLFPLRRAGIGADRNPPFPGSQRLQLYPISQERLSQRRV